ncbi:hypothetical protein OS493_017646 [Desmophyllum pertusum]|uniref:Uncharacterized protein n=1 Tax=Desmophyllum pertusum TaxID=174260 RepID=A0A9W9ZEJ0_9CNID|nr:hypothetical protein OS493_017646 [Desmophyllum pertusum]
MKAVFIDFSSVLFYGDLHENVIMSFYDGDMVLSDDEIVPILTEEDFHRTASDHVFGLSKFKRSNGRVELFHTLWIRVLV